MAEVAGLAASIFTLLQVSKEVVDYVRLAKNNTSTILQLAQELENLAALLETLEKEVQQPSSTDNAHPALLAFVNLKGPLRELKVIIEQLAKKLRPKQGYKKVFAYVTLPFDDTEVKEKLLGIERYKTQVLIALNTYQVALNKNTDRNVTVVIDDNKLVKRHVTALRADQIRRERHRVSKWLSTLDISLVQNELISQHRAGTGQWFLDHPEFLIWKADSGRPLWLFGNVGHGKTVLCSTIVQHLVQERPSSALLAYFYFGFNDPLRRSTRHCLRSLLAQLYATAAAPPASIVALYEDWEISRQQPSDEMLFASLCSTATESRPVYIILDALDECVDRHTLIDFLERLGGQKAREVHFLLVSRSEPDLERALGVPSNSTISIDAVGHTNDIKTHIHQSLNEGREWQRLGEPLKLKVEQTLVEKANGMFRWVACQLESLRRCRSRSAINEALKTLPRDLDETYERMLCRIVEEDSSTACALLQWLAFTQRPLTIEELAEAIIFRPGSFRLDTDTEAKLETLDEERFLDTSEVLELCSSLVVRTRSGSGHSMVSLAHLSVVEFLTSDRIRRSHARRYAIADVDSHTYLGNTCLLYLAMFDRSDMLPNAVSVFDGTEQSFHRKLDETFPLLRYSARHWPYHVEGARTIGGSTQIRIDHILAIVGSSNSQRFCNWHRVFRSERGFSEMPNFEVTAPLVCLSYLGIVECIGPLLDRLIEQHATRDTGSLMPDKESNETKLQPALRTAAERGHQAMVRALLDRGADPTAGGGTYGNILQAAVAHRCNLSVIQTLCEAGARVDDRGGYYETVLQAAAAASSVEVVEWLLHKGADVNARGGHHGSALHAAAARLPQGGDIFRLLIQKDADVNMLGAGSDSILRVAANRGDTASVELLLQHGATVDQARGKYPETPLQAAAIRGNIQTVQVLLRAGADVHVQGHRFGDAMQAAASEGHFGIVELLLQEGAAVNTQGGYFCTALQAAAARGHFEVADFLLQREADVTIQGGKFGTALQAAATQGHPGLVRRLLEAGADVNARTGDYGTALQAAAAEGSSLEVLEMLLAADADVDAQCGRFGNALQAAALRGNLDFVRRLLPRVTDVNARGSGGCSTALQSAAERGNLEMAELLLQREVDVNAPGGRWGSALHGAVRSKSLEIVGLLLRKGARIEAQGHYRDTPLQAAAYVGDVSIIKELLQAGSDVNAQGGYLYGTALQAAVVKSRSIEVIELLLSWGADINAEGGEFGTALQAAAIKAVDATVVDLLLQRGANAAAQGGVYGSAIKAAKATGSSTQVIQRLSQASSLNKASTINMSPLSHSFSPNSQPAVSLQAESNVDLETNGWTAG
ncbi:MAG: hypothetical protein M1817_005541 [Caeruleum heppii]|nr:MAG: hypothetical protein M1817_005541 [Caeruleum heppii]